jgi:hypothetical protein
VTIQPTVAGLLVILLERSAGWWPETEAVRRLTRAACMTLAFSVCAGCASLQDMRPWAGIELHDKATRAAMPRWQDAGRLWIGFKARFE